MNALKERILDVGIDRTAKLWNCSSRTATRKRDDTGSIRVDEIRQFAKVKRFTVTECFEIVNGRRPTLKELEEAI